MPFYLQNIRAKNAHSLPAINGSGCAICCIKLSDRSRIFAQKTVPAVLVLAPIESVENAFGGIRRYRIEKTRT
jgi:hypothetical protein